MSRYVPNVSIRPPHCWAIKKRKKRSTSISLAVFQKSKGGNNFSNFFRHVTTSVQSESQWAGNKNSKFFFLQNSLLWMMTFTLVSDNIWTLWGYRWTEQVAPRAAATSPTSTCCEPSVAHVKSSQNSYKSINELVTNFVSFNSHFVQCCQFNFKMINLNFKNAKKWRLSSLFQNSYLGKFWWNFM